MPVAQRACCPATRTTRLAQLTREPRGRNRLDLKDAGAAYGAGTWGDLDTIERTRKRAQLKRARLAQQSAAIGNERFEWRVVIKAPWPVQFGSEDKH